MDVSKKKMELIGYQCLVIFERDFSGRYSENKAAMSPRKNKKWTPKM